MPSSVQEELDKILKKLLRCDLDDLLDDLEIVLANKEITEEERIKTKLLQSSVYSQLYDFGEEKGSRELSFELTQEAVKESNNLGDNYLITASKMWQAMEYFVKNNWKEYLETMEEALISFEKLEPRTDLFHLMIKALVMMNKGNIPFLKIYTGESPSDEEREEAFQLYIEGEKFGEENNLPYVQTVFLGNLLYFYYFEGELDLVLESAKKIVKIAKEKGSKRLIILALNKLANAHYIKADYKNFYEISKERLRICEEINLKLPIASSYWNLGQYHLLIGEYEEALEYFEKAYEIIKKYERKILEAGYQRAIGNLYFLKGELDKAVEFYDQAFTVFKENQPQNWHTIFGDLAEIYIQKGDLEKALEYLDQLKIPCENFKDLFCISDVLTKQGQIYWQKGMKEKALSSMQEGLEIRQQIDNKNFIANSLSYLIQFNVELNNIEAARKYFEALDLINRETKVKEVSLNCRFSEALILKRSSDLRDRMKAEVLFEQLIEDGISYSLLVQVLLNLCDLHILEMKETNDSKVLEKIYKNVNKLQEMAEKNNSHLLNVETIRLNAQLALLEFDIDNARALLLKALNIAQTNNFDRLVLDLLSQQKRLTKQSIELKSLEKTSSTISQRMTVVDFNDTVSSIKRTSITETVKKEEEVSKKLLSIKI